MQLARRFWAQLFDGARGNYSSLWLNNFGQALFLIFLFALTFSVPVVLVPRIRDSIRGSAVTSDGSETEQDALFPEAISFFTGADRSLEFGSAGAALSPVKDKDFLFTGWYKLRRMPADGERVVLARKVETQSEGSPGYALAVVGREHGLEPAVLWRDGSKLGRWFFFTPVKVEPREWFMLAVSFHEGRFLGLHGVVRHSKIRPEEADETPTVALLGGYDVGELALPDNAVGPTFNPSGQARVFSRLGAYGFFVLPGLKNRLRGFLDEIGSNPTTVPSELEKRALYWSDGRGGHQGSVAVEPALLGAGGGKRARNLN